MLTPRAHNALVRRIRCADRLAARLDPRLPTDTLTGEFVVEAPGETVAADLLVLLDHLDLHTGTRFTVEPLAPLRYRVTGAGADPPPTTEFQAWPGRIERIAVITRDRPESLSAVLDSFADNLRRFGREYVEIAVYDDSGVGVRDEVRAVAQARSARYVGPDEKHARRTEIEARLPGPAAERAAVLDALLGRREADGTWTGSAAAQRNWAILSAAGARILVCDDDVRPAVLDAPLAALCAAARDAVRAGAAGRPGDLLETYLRTTEVEAWPTDLLGALEDSDPGLVSAAYTGHPDRRTALWLERFFETGDASVDVLGTGIPPQRVRRGEPAATGRKFRGGAFVTGGSPDALEFAVRRGRNEDFSLALSARITGGPEPTEARGAHILHLRGPRATSTFTAHREEREGYVVNAVVRRIGRAHAITYGSFEPETFREFGLATLDAELGREFATADVGGELYDEGLAYRDRALEHLKNLPCELLRDGVAALRDGTVPADRVLMECAHVLVPQGFLTTLRVPAMRREWRRLSDVERAEAARCLSDEARYLTSVRATRTAERARDLADHIDHELRGTREEFRADLRRRVRAEVALYLTAMPYVARVRAELALKDLVVTG